MIISTHDSVGKSGELKKTSLDSKLISNLISLIEKVLSQSKLTSIQELSNIDNIIKKF